MIEIMLICLGWAIIGVVAIVHMLLKSDKEIIDKQNRYEEYIERGTK